MAVTTINIDSQILTFANLAAFPLVGTVKTIYIAEDTDISYYWDGAAYQDITIDTSGLVPAGLITSSGLTMNTARLLGRGTAGVGAVEEIVIGSGLTLTGTTLSAAGGGITIGTTAIASGTVGRILFEGAGNVVQQDSTFVWNNTDKRLILGADQASVDTNPRLVVVGKNPSGTTTLAAFHNSTGNNNALVVRDDGFVGIGYNAPLATEKVRINGGTRIQNGFLVAETATNNFVTLNNGVIDQRRDGNFAILNSFTNVAGGANSCFGWRMSYGFGGTDFTHIITTQTTYTNAEFGGEGQNFVLWNRAQNSTGNPRMKFVITRFNQGVLDFQTSSFDFTFGAGSSIGSPTPALRITSRGNIIVGGTTANGVAKRVVAVYNGTAPNGNLTDAFQLYSAGITAGNAAPHFRTENGDVVKLYQEAAVTTVQGLADALTNQGLLASSTIPTIDELQIALTAQVFS
jgi:hypothetical protein